MKTKGFQIIHLSTSHHGGAGIAARRLHQKLLSSGLKSTFVAIDRKDFLPQNGEVKMCRSKIIRLIGFINSFFSQAISNDTYFTLFSIPAMRYKSLQKFGDPEETIFHVHNWFNLINLRIMRKLLNDGYKLVFTLHDQRLFTGGCHYSLNCNEFKNNCTKCPMLSAPINRLTKWNVIRAERLFQKFSNKIIIIAPSNWIRLAGNDSFILKNIQITPVLNIHTEPKNLELLLNDRKKIRTERKIALGVATMQKQSTIKGGKILEKLEQVIKSEKIAAELFYLADFQTENHSPHLFWSSIDYLLVTSKIDNSPNVIHEAKMLGIPVIATNVGGIPELLNFEYDYLVKMNDQVLEQITKILKDINDNPKYIDEYQIIENYKKYSEKSLISLLDLYNSLLESDN
jgi:glycosyltransferase involved in cell wall biosynthesis